VLGLQLELVLCFVFDGMNRRVHLLLSLHPFPRFAGDELTVFSNHNIKEVNLTSNKILLKFYFLPSFFW